MLKCLGEETLGKLERKICFHHRYMYFTSQLFLHKLYFKATLKYRFSFTSMNFHDDDYSQGSDY